MPKFEKSTGFTQGSNPFTMKPGSKEIDTEGSFRKEATDKMQEHSDSGSPFFAIQASQRDAGAAYDDSSVTEADYGEDKKEDKKKDKKEDKKKEVAETTSTLENTPEETVSVGNTELGGVDTSKIDKIADAASGIDIAGLF
tara:strand:- start:1262 stop:1684 length:423 start_codon:yes stop_codon:yes gene_type:complete